MELSASDVAGIHAASDQDELVEAGGASSGFCPLTLVHEHFLQSMLTGVGPWDAAGTPGHVPGAGTERRGGGSACALTDVAGAVPAGLPAGDLTPAQSPMSPIASAAPTVSAAGRTQVGSVTASDAGQTQAGSASDDHEMEAVSVHPRARHW